jgi:hypothetical protein
MKMVKQTTRKRHVLGPGPGRPKGGSNKTTALLKDAILKAAEGAGGKAGLVGYLQCQAKKNPGPFMALLGKVLPTQVANDGDEPFKITVIERIIIDGKAENKDG